MIEIERTSGEKTQFEYNGDGQISHRTDALGTTQFDYSPSGELVQVTNPDGSHYRYRYNALSLRTQADIDGFTTDYGYDALGRLVTVGSMVYGHNADNQVTTIASPGDPTTEIGYDSRGNVIRYGIGEQTHTYSYDAVGRFTAVNPSHGNMVQQNYAPNEADWRARSDTRTAINLSPEQTASAVYGSYADIFLGRSQAMKLSAARYEPSSKTLQAITNLGFIQPDAGIKAVLSRSQLDSKAEDPASAATAFNRPSNSFFLPPEFRSNNCLVACDMVDSNLNVDDFIISLGEIARFTLDSRSRPQQSGNLTGPGDPLVAAPPLQGCGAQVVWDMGDGTPLFNRPADTTSSLPEHDHFIYRSRLNHQYTSVGSFFVSAVSFCSCFGLISTASVSIAVTPTCTDQRRANHHRTGFKANVPPSRFQLSNPNHMNKGHFKIKTIGASTATYDLFVAGISLWNGTFTFGQTTWTNDFTFERVGTLYVGDDFIALHHENHLPTDPELGSAVQGGTVVNLDPQRATAETAGHEFGHILGFPDAYTKLPTGFGQDLECHELDIMSTSKPTISVKGYHGQVFAEMY